MDEVLDPEAVEKTLSRLEAKSVDLVGPRMFWASGAPLLLGVMISALFGFPFSLVLGLAESNSEIFSPEMKEFILSAKPVGLVLVLVWLPAAGILAAIRGKSYETRLNACLASRSAVLRKHYLGRKWVTPHKGVGEAAALTNDEYARIAVKFEGGHVWDFDREELSLAPA